MQPHAQSPIERAARALARLTGTAEDAMIDDKPHWQRFIPQARAVLEAIRDPDDMMREAGAEIIKGAVDGQSAEAQQSDAANVWRFMIDAAIAYH